MSEEDLEFNMGQNIRLMLRVLMVRKKIETQLGQLWLFKTRNQTFLIAYFGILTKSSNGPIQNLHKSQSKVTGFMKHMLVWLKNSEESPLIETLPNTIFKELKMLVTM